MAIRGNTQENRTRNYLSILLILSLCCFFYVLGTWQNSGIGRGDSIALTITKQTECTLPVTLTYQTHDSNSTKFTLINQSNPKIYEPCEIRYTDYTPCHDQKRAMSFPRENMVYRERHCPLEREKLYCLIPPPKGYLAPFVWPKSRDFVPYANVPYKSLTVEKAVQNWVQFEGTFFKFPGGGTQFPQGADKYIDWIASVIPIQNGTIRTALDTGCGVASFGAYLMSRNVLTMSFAPKDNHEAQVQFALERGVPAVIGVLGSVKLPYPSRSFDMAHCSRCLIRWTSNDGLYMMEIDRVLRPGGYWVLSGPPINWRNNYKWWKRTREDLEQEQRKIEEFATLLCWEKVSEIMDIAIWRKRENGADPCSGIKTCESTNPDVVWYKKMEVCKTLIPNPNSLELDPFPKRLYSVPPRITSGSIPGLSAQSFNEDSKLWQRHVNAYKKVNTLLDSRRFRNILDMNAGLGGFAAALETNKSWVLNVVPTIADVATLGVIYERGLIGIYHDWCEAFSTYPRTYDLIHANRIFTLYHNRCKTEDILLEMDRILRPEGVVIIRDSFDALIRVTYIVGGMRWNATLVDHESGSHLSEKVLYAVKQYWVGGGENSKK